MNGHKALAWVIRICAVLAILCAFWPVTKQLIVHVTSVGRIGTEHTDYAVGKPQWEMLPVIWRSGYIKKLFRSLMIGLSFFGGLRIGLLILKNRGKPRVRHNRRVRRPLAAAADAARCLLKNGEGAGH
jgi:hypothetical protein